MMDTIVGLLFDISIFVVNNTLFYMPQLIHNFLFQ